MKVLMNEFAWLPKDELTHMQVAALKAQLTVTPRKFAGIPGPDPLPIRLYEENDSHIGIPRAYFLQHKKPHHEVIDVTSEGRKDLWGGIPKFAGKLRPDQQLALDKVLTAFRSDTTGGMIKASPGYGKSPRVGTPILKYDGTVVPVEDLRVGDLLMGPDSTPRTVLITNRGYGPLYRITPVKGDPWECNDVHILTLVDYKTNNVVDINLQDYLNLAPSWKHRLKQFAPPNGIDFAPAAPLPLDPYFVGIWYGDGTKALNGVAISKPDPEIHSLCVSFAERYGLRVRTEVRGTCPTHHLVGEAGNPNPLLDLLRSIYLTGDTLPHAYLTSSRVDRKAFLAGWLDSDGYHNNGCYEIVQKRHNWALGIAFLARSLGFRANVRKKLVNGDIYWRVDLSGDFSDIPMRIPRKLPRVRLQKKIATRTGFSVERIEDGEYVGIVLDGDHRYLLGDFTVTHNTVWSCALMSTLQVPALVVVHKEFLMNQWKERIEQFLPGTKVGIVQQDQCEYEGCGVVIGMMHSLVGERDYGADFWSWPGIILADECHHIAAQSFSNLPRRFNAKWRMGVSATPRRKDGTEAVFYNLLGPILYESSEQRMNPKIRRVWTDFHLVQTAGLNPSLVGKNVLLKFLCGNVARNKLIVDQMIQAVQMDRKLIILSDRLKHLDTLDAMFRREWTQRQLGAVPAVGFYVGGMKEEELSEAAKARVIFATTVMASEGLDIPPLDTLFLVTPMSDVDQAAGRILRPSEGKKEPIIVDFRDEKVSYCEKSASYRDRFYQSKKWM